MQLDHSGWRDDVFWMHAMRHNVAIFLVTRAEALGLGPQMHESMALDTGFRRYDGAGVM